MLICLGSLFRLAEFTLQAKLRLGFSGQTVLAALGQAAVYNEEHSKPLPNIKSPLEEVCFLFWFLYFTHVTCGFRLSILYSLRDVTSYLLYISVFVCIY